MKQYWRGKKHYQEYKRLYCMLNHSKVSTGIVLKTQQTPLPQGHKRNQRWNNHIWSVHGHSTFSHALRLICKLPSEALVIPGPLSFQGRAQTSIYDMHIPHSSQQTARCRQGKRLLAQVVFMLTRCQLQRSTTQDMPTPKLFSFFCHLFLLFLILGQRWNPIMADNFWTEHLKYAFFI